MGRITRCARGHARYLEGNKVRHKRNFVGTEIESPAKSSLGVRNMHEHEETNDTELRIQTNV